MKTFLFSALVCVSALVACKKSYTPDDPQPKTTVNFNVSEFTVQSASGKSPASISEVGDTLKNYVGFLYYRVYNSSGTLVKARSQTSSLASFGNIADTLAQGDYTVVFAASKKALAFNNSSLESDFFKDEANSYWDDTFYKKISLTVGAAPVNQSVRLERIVAGLQLNIQEDLPFNIAQITITVEDDDLEYKIGNNTSASPVSITRNWSIFDEENVRRKSVLMHIINTNRPKRVIIKGYQYSGSLAVTRTIENVSFSANKKTVFSGDLGRTVKLIVQVDPVWNTPLGPIRY